MQNLKNVIGINKETSKIEISLQEKCDFENSHVGDLKYYNCGECLNRGFINIVQNDNIVVKRCKCLKIRNNNKNLFNCGISPEMFSNYTFDSFTTNADWRKKIKSRFLKYIEEIKNGSKKWLYIGAISGLGKTHLCTALSKELINLGFELKYFLWKDEIIKLKQLKKSSYTESIEKYQEKMNYIKSVDVLYIDDFLKLIDNYSKEEDLNLAYEIINARSVNNKITIISSEYERKQLMDFDLALFGRIYYACNKEQDYFLYSTYDENRNYRIKGDE